MEVTLAGRIGTPGKLTMLGAGVSNERLDFPGYPTRAEADLVGGPERDLTHYSTAALVGHQTLHSAGTYVNMMVAQRNVRFLEPRGQDALRGTRNMLLGT